MSPRFRAWLGLSLLINSVLYAADAPRAARSVHLGYAAPEGDLFYNEMVVEQSVSGSYFMACGWDTGYFGIQQLNNPTNKVVIFSVWDPTKGDDPKAVRTEDRVENLFAGEGVRIKRFGGEGTGGQSMAPLLWNIGETNRFVVQTEAHSNKTAYTAWIFDGAKSDWRKLATFRTRTGGRSLRGYYSFVEDFRRDTRSVNEVRRARFGNGWVRTTQGEWVPLDAARFTASNATWESKDNIDAGRSNQWFYLATGGTTRRSSELKSTIRLPDPPTSHPDFPFLPAR
jgi:hypothetical protein